MKIAFFEMKEKKEMEYIKKNLKGHQLYFFKDQLDKFDINKAGTFDVISVFIYSDINAQMVSKLNVKAIITRSTGFNHIDVKACNKKGIKVYNVPKYGSNTVAEYTFALLLSLIRKITLANERVKNLDFNLDGLEGRDLKGKTIGIVGLGEIGQCVAEIAKGFKMNIIVSTQTKYPEFAKRVGLKFVDFKYLLRNSDIITLHVPLTPETKHLINLKNISLIKKGAILINTSRGEIVENAAILRALNKNILSGAGLDVLEAEELIKDERQLFSKKHSREELKKTLGGNILLEQKNVIVTPHNAFNTKEALQRILDVTIENVGNAVKNKKENMVELK